MLSYIKTSDVIPRSIPGLQLRSRALYHNDALTPRVVWALLTQVFIRVGKLCDDDDD